ncbi:MAG TPA: YwbE family protein, partial [Candidatus Desulfaltia sp.]|nr:YwbE family protein [Candidatus Desulfaltia sp.]
LTRGVVKDILTNSPTHPHGIKVRLTDGKVGRVQQILPKKQE